MTNTRLEQDLKDVLAERAWSIPPTLDPYGRTARAIAVDRRRRSVLLAAGVAVVTVLAVAPIAIVATFDGSDQTAARPSNTATPIRLPDRGIVDWRLSGDLAGNPDAVTQARADLVLAAQRDPAVDGIQLLAVGSAGDDGNYLVGLAHSASSDTGYDYDRVTVYIAGPGDAAATATATLRADEMANRQVLAYPVAGGNAGHDYLLVAARPGIDRVEFSIRRQFGPNGDPARAYQLLELHNGVSVTPLPYNPSDPVLRVRGFRGSELGYDGFVTMARFAGGTQFADRVLDRLAKDMGADPGEVGAAIRGVITGYGLDLSAATADLIWSGRVPGSAGTAALVKLRLPSGGEFQLVLQFAERHGGHVLLRQTRFVPAGTAVSWPIAWISDEAIGCRLTVVVPPAGALRVDASYVAASGTIPAGGHTAGHALTINRCPRPSEPSHSGVLLVTDARTGAELMRWDLRLPLWVYERTDETSDLLGR